MVVTEKDGFYVRRNNSIQTEKLCTRYSKKDYCVSMKMNDDDLTGLFIDSVNRDLETGNNSVRRRQECSIR